MKNLKIIKTVSVHNFQNQVRRLSKGEAAQRDFLNKDPLFCRTFSDSGFQNNKQCMQKGMLLFSDFIKMILEKSFRPFMK